MIKIPLNKPYLDRKEIAAVTKVLKSGKLGADYSYSRTLINQLKQYLKTKIVYLTPSCTSAMELALRVLKFDQGGEVIVPSFTMTSTANVILTCGLNPRFVEIEKSNLSIDPVDLEKRINKKTRAIMLVHYGGRVGEIEKIKKIAKAHNLFIIEDAACALGTFYNGISAGNLGDFGAFSFHETKNLVCGEGGCLTTNRASYQDKIDIIRDHGTNRTLVLKGVASSYVWQEWGGSFLLSDVLAAIMSQQMEKVNYITKKRKQIALNYLKRLSELQPKIELASDTPWTNWHTFYFLVPQKKRDKFLNYARSNGVGAAFHYLPLHDSPMGRKLGYKKGQFSITEQVAYSLVRIPIYPGLTDKEQEKVIEVIKKAVKKVL